MFWDLLDFVVIFSPSCYFLRKYITNKATNNIQVVAPWRELSQNITEEIGTHKTCEENTVGCTYTSPTHCLQFVPFVSVFVGSPRKQATASLWNIALGIKLLKSSWLHFLSSALLAYKTWCVGKCSSTTVHSNCSFSGVLCKLPCSSIQKIFQAALGSAFISWHNYSWLQAECYCSMQCDPLACSGNVAQIPSLLFGQNWIVNLGVLLSKWVPFLSLCCCLENSEKNSHSVLLMREFFSSVDQVITKYNTQNQTNSDENFQWYTFWRIGFLVFG